MKKTIRKVHMWLGILTGPIVFVVALTGCIYAFQQEIQDATQPYRFVQEQAGPMLPPSELIQRADEANPGKHLHAVMYRKEGRAAEAIYYSFEEDYYDYVYLDPYSGQVQQVHDVRHSFFGFILDGHFYLWLPPQVGKPVVAISTLIFTLLLISGIYLWWPRKKNNRKQKFRIKWNARWRRKNYDLHSVLGFYAAWIAIVFALTGLVWGFGWFRDAVYKVASGGEDYVAYYSPVGDSTQLMAPQEAIDQVWLQMQSECPQADWIELHPSEDGKSAIAANANPDESTYWKLDYRYFDPNTLDELSVDHQWGRIQEATVAHKLMRMNYDIHVGGIAGLPGKVLAFCISLLIASLPVTGFLVWYGRKRKSKAQRMPGVEQSNEARITQV